MTNQGAVQAFRPCNPQEHAFIRQSLDTPQQLADEELLRLLQCLRKLCSVRVT